MITKSYKTKGTCSREIELSIDDNGIIQDVKFVGGCSGNTQGVSALVKGRKAADVANILRGIKCGDKATSCPDQLAQALKAYKASHQA